MSELVIECPNCGRKMPSYRSQCFSCDHIEVKEAQYFVDEAKKFAPEKKQLVSDERVEEIAASLAHLDDVLPADNWYMRASYKMHDTRYRDTDPFALKSCGALTATMTGLTVEDVTAWWSVQITDKWDEQDEVNRKISEQECSSINRGYAASLEGEDTWFRLQRLIEEDNLGIADEYSIQIALKKSRALVGYTVETIDLTPNTNSNKPTIDINTLAMNANDARDRSGTKNHARRSFITVGYETIKSVKVGKNDEPIDIIRKLEAEEFGTQEPIRVKVTNIGTNPYTHEQVRVPSRPIDYNTIRVDGQVREDALEPLRKFYGQFDMHKHNYVGLVNKKSDGRSLTGYPDPKSGEHMQHNRHQPVIIITPNVKIQETTHTVQFKQLGALQQEKEIAKVTRGEDCECGCNVKVKDMRRGEVICPQCGLVFHRDTIVG